MDRKNTCTPVKGFLEKTAGRLSHNFGCESPFHIMPNVSTPPSRFVKIKNPFEPSLTERLHTHFLSPTIFTKKGTPKVEEIFKWNIDEISTMKPADIDEASIDQHELSEHDQTMESFAQAKIDKFFSMKEIVPSPFNQPIKQEPLLSEKSLASPEHKMYKDGTSQTILTLPPKLPKEVEAVLKPYFSYTEEQQETNVENSSLYRKLFDFNEIDTNDTTSSTCSSPPLSLSPPRLKLLNSKDIQERCNFSSTYDVFENVCNLSPIVSSPMKRASKSNKTAISLNSSSHSNNSSMNIVPSNEVMSNTCSMRLEYSYEAVQMEECLSNSIVNWEMEYKNVSLATPTSKDCSTDEMDVSNSNTPRSKIFISQRKKLSDSFLSDSEDTENKENTDKFKNGIQDKATSSKLLVYHDLTDAGYQTGSCTMSEDCSASWSTSNLYASTPTKVKF